MENSLNDSTKEWFKTPKNVVAVKIDPTTGYLASDDCKNKITMYYEKGNVPSIACDDHYHKSSLTVNQ